VLYCYCALALARVRYHTKRKRFFYLVSRYRYLVLYTYARPVRFLFIPNQYIMYAYVFIIRRGEYMRVSASRNWLAAAGNRAREATAVERPVIIKHADRVHWLKRGNTNQPPAAPPIHPFASPCPRYICKRSSIILKGRLNLRDSNSFYPWLPLN
jgi:hypothetical protein